MKNVNRKTSVSTAILLFTTGCIFTALGVAIFVIVIKGIIEYGISKIGIGIILPIIFILALLGFGITLLIMGGKKIYLRIRQCITYYRGKDGIARIADYKSASFGKSHNMRIRYALIIAYNYNGENKTFTTDYLYDVNEYRYLKKLDGVKVKVNGNFVTVCEPFPKDIYNVDSTYGIETAYFKQKPVTVMLWLWRIFFFAAVVFLIVSFFIGKSNITLAAIYTLISVNFLFVIPLAIYFIKWIKRK